ncbi:lipoprotein insertase outer membrane protein LolB [Zoogloea sp.]|uniref:lipoprotein insertase outer membrane protein LolB n=1 Tax=Zoogloea sp. TaxID=49181 RepID=UPI00258EB008|nr:lipoprotein insertase outer membrane protein LolB [Zoogloea sp.]MBT9497410.1 outer membrane lipoprotein LolB [Zoogloea sp.]MDD2668923.1 lipoprotein insertase outer membrane protein LolB [Zoogloea sp.]
MRRLIVLLALGVLGCAAPDVRPPDALQLASRAEMSRFQLEGRLQVRDGERTAAVGVDWQHEVGHDDWLFTGPLGQGLARIEADAAGARMTLADGQRVEAASAAELAETALGVNAPFAQLPLWITARLRDGAEVRELDPVGRLRRVVDQGWTIDYIEYAGSGPADLPRKIDVQRGDTRLRLIVDAWNP